MKRPWRWEFALFFALCAPVRAADESCFAKALGSGRDKSLETYETSRIRNLAAKRSWRDFQARSGWIVTKRDATGAAQEARVRVLLHNTHAEAKLVGDFNGWNSGSGALPLKPVPGTPYVEGEVKGIRQGMEYRIVVDGESRLDPSAPLFTTPEYKRRTTGQESDYLNSVFWDFDDPKRNRPRIPGVDLREKPALIAEGEIFELARHWQGGPPTKGETYAFVARSGLPKKLRSMGYNAVELLPFNASIDGDSWHLRYQVYGLFAPDSRYGTPDDFIDMIDAFHKERVAVIMDGVVGHFPYTGNTGVRDIGAIGLHTWKKVDGSPLFAGIDSPWHTKRYDYQNPHVRRFLTDSLLEMMKRYNIDGVRFDNLDGIRFEPGGTELLDGFVKEVRDYRPDAHLIGEMFFGDNRVMRRIDRGGMGMGWRTDSDFFDFIKDNLLKRAEDVDMNKLRAALRNPWDWNEVTRSRYTTNHDEAANGRDGATGQYIASLLGGGTGFHVEGKTKSFNALAMLSSSSYLDLPQMRLLQEGNFYKNPAVEWAREEGEAAARTQRVFAALSKYIEAKPAFAPRNLHPDVENHTDYANKVVSLLRIDVATGKRSYALVNLSSQNFDNYRLGVESPAALKLGFDADAVKLGGSGKLEGAVPPGGLVTEAQSAHGKSRSVRVPNLPPYGVVVLEE